MSARFAVVVLGGTVLALGCAGAHARTGLQPATIESAARERCRAAELPRTLPPVNSVVDSAALVARLAGRSATAGSTETVVSLSFGRDGAVQRVVQLIRGENADGATATARMVRALARSHAPDSAWDVRLHIAGGAQPRLSVGRAQFCPAVVDESSLPAGGEIIVSDEQWREMKHAQTYVLRLLIGLNGKVETVRLTQSTGYVYTDHDVIKDAEDERWHPALLDGAPVEAWHVIHGRRPIVMGG